MVETQTETISILFLNGINFETKNRPHSFFLKTVESSSRIIG